MLNSRYKLIIQSTECNIRKNSPEKSVPICYKNCNLRFQVENKKQNKTKKQEKKNQIFAARFVPLSNLRQVKKIKTPFKRINKILLFFKDKGSIQFDRCK